MTSPGGSGDINLATLWIPIVPETSHIGEAARRAGEQMKRELMYGFGSFEEFGGAMGSGIMRGLERSNLPGMFDPVLMAISGKQALMIGAVAGAVETGINLVSRAVETMLATVVKGAEAVANEVVKVGFTFDELNKSLILYTDNQKTNLEEMSGLAAQVYGQLDVGAENLAKNMAVLSQNFNLTGDDLKTLTYQITELEGRFGGFDIRSLSAAMHQFGVVDAKGVSDALRTIISDARQFGIDSDQLQRAMVSTGPVFEQLGINIYSASEAMAKIQQLGDQPRDILLGISKAASEMGKTNSAEDLKATTEQLINVVDQYHKMGNDAAAQELLSTYFGPRYWAQTYQALQFVQDAMHGVGGAARGMPLEELYDKSRTVREEWIRLQHQFELFVKPVSEPVMKSFQEALKQVEEWFNRNHDQILEKIDQWGHAFINAIPTIKTFVADAIEIFGVFFDATIHGFSDLVKLGGDFLEIWGTITGSDKAFNLGQSIIQDLDKLDRIDFSKLTTKIGEAVRNWDTSGLQNELGKNLDEAIQKALEAPDDTHIGGGERKSLKLPIEAQPKGPDGAPIDKDHPLKSLFGIDPDNPLKIPVSIVPGNSPDAKPGDVINQPPNSAWLHGDTSDKTPWWDKPPFGPIPGIGPFLRSIFGEPGPGGQPPYGAPGQPGPPGLPGVGGNLPRIPGHPSGYAIGSGFDLGSGGFDWDEVARAESTNNWANPDTGGSGHYGGLQFANATWLAFGGGEFAPRADMATREQQIIVANRTAFSGYGGTPPQGLGAWETVTNGMARVGGISGGMAAYNAGFGGSTGMGYMPSYGMYGMGGMGGMGGGDYSGLQQVIFSNTMTGQKTGEAGPYSGGGAPAGGMNQLVGPGTNQPQYYEKNWGTHQGHVHTSWVTSPSGEPYGLDANTTINPGEAGFPGWVYELSQQYGLLPSTYPGHQVLADGKQHGIDWSPPGGGDMLSGAGDSAGQIDIMQNFATSMATAGAGGGVSGMAGPGMMMGYGGGGGGGPQIQLADWNTHKGGGGSHGGGGGRAPGPGGHGSGQPYDPFKIPIQIDQRTLDLDRANDRITDLNKELQIDEQKLPLLKQKLDDADKALQVHNLPDDPLYAGLKQKQIEAQDSYDSLVERIRRIQEEDLPEAGLNRDKATMKSEEPLKGGASLGGGQYNAAEQLGAGFLSGIFSDLGMGNVLGGKTPDQWGIVRLLGGLAGYGVGLGNSMLGAQQGAMGGIPHIGGLPGLAQGASNAIGLPGLPSIAKMVAPHAQGPGPGNTGAGGAGGVPGIINLGGGHDSGTVPFTTSGPATQDNRIIVSGNFKDNGDLINHLSDVRNSRAASITA